jgi:hypothetical protein
MRSINVWVYVSVLLALVSTGLAMRMRQAPTELATYIVGRKFVLVEQARHASQGLTLIVGDSIVEWSYFHEACGAPVFNAGITSAGLHDLAPLAAELTTVLQPTSIILAIGTNDAAVDRVIPAADWARDYEKLVASLPADRVELVAIPEIQDGGSSSGTIDIAEIVAKNRRLHALAARHGVAFAPSVRFETSDGLHPTRAGAAKWLENVETQCPSASSRGARSAKGSASQ